MYSKRYVYCGLIIFQCFIYIIEIVLNHKTDAFNIWFNLETPYHNCLHFQVWQIWIKIQLFNSAMTFTSEFHCHLSIRSKFNWRWLAVFLYLIMTWWWHPFTCMDTKGLLMRKRCAIEKHISCHWHYQNIYASELKHRNIYNIFFLHRRYRVISTNMCTWQLNIIQHTSFK